MTKKQLEQIIEFAKPFYRKSGRWHAWDHIIRVQRLSLAIAKAEFPKADKNVLVAAATLHDIGRISTDDGHARESGRIAEPFLRSIGLPEEEIQHVLDAFIHHEVQTIHEAKSLEARIVFDADKIDILSTYGFMRVAFWLIEERQMSLDRSMNFLWKYCELFQNNLYSKYAKKLVRNDMKLISQYVSKFNDYSHTWNDANNVK